MLDSNRQILLILVTLAIAAGQSIVFTVIPPLGREVGFSEFEITLIISSSALVFAIFAPIWGRISERRGRKPVLLIGLWGYALGSLLFTLSFEIGRAGLLAGNLLVTLMIITRTLQASWMSATPTAVMAYVADNTAIEYRAKTLARIGAGNNLGTIIGPAIAGAIAVMGLTAPLYFAAAFAVMGAIAIGLVLEHAPVANPATSIEKSSVSLLDPRIRLYMLVGVICFFCFAANQQTLAFSLQDRLSLTGAETVQIAGAMLMCLAISSVISQGVIMQKMRIAPLKAVLIGATFSAVGYIAMASANDHLWFYGLSMFCIGMGLGFIMPNIAALSSAAVSERQQGAVAGYNSSLPAMGFVLGPVSGGALYQINPVLPQLLSIVLMAGVGLLLGWLYIRAK